MELLNIEECEVTIKLGCDACLELAEGLRRGASQTGPGEQRLDHLWESAAAMLQAAAYASSVYAEHDPEIRGARTFGEYRQRHIATLVPEWQRPPAEAPAAD